MWINLDVNKTSSFPKLRELVLLASSLGKDKVYFLNEWEKELDTIKTVTNDYEMEYEFLSLKEMIDRSPYEVTEGYRVKDICAALSKDLEDRSEPFTITGRHSLGAKDFKDGLKEFKRIKY